MQLTIFPFFCNVKTIVKASYDKTIIHKQKFSDEVIKGYNCLLRHILESYLK